MSSKETLQLLRDYESRNILFIEPDGSWPIIWERAKDVFVWDADGEKYLDLTAAFGVAAAGHANAKVVKAGQKQMARLLHAMGDVHPHARKAELARELSRVTFERWNKKIRQNDFQQFWFRGCRISAQNRRARDEKTRRDCFQRRVSRTRLRRAQRHPPRFFPQPVSIAAS